MNHDQLKRARLERGWNQQEAAARPSLGEKDITLFALVDHSGEATKVGMKMPNTKLLILGNPKGGTPLMLRHRASRSTCR
jgi:hypothetical protein